MNVVSKYSKSGSYSLIKWNMNNTLGFFLSFPHPFISFCIKETPSRVK